MIFQFKNSNELSAIDVNQISSVQVNDLKQEIMITLKNAKYVVMTYNDHRQMFDEYDLLLNKMDEPKEQNGRIFDLNRQLNKSHDKLKKHLKVTTRLYAEKGKKLRQEKHELFTENQILKSKLLKYGEPL